MLRLKNNDFRSIYSYLKTLNIQNKSDEEINKELQIIYPKILRNISKYDYAKSQELTDLEMLRKLRK
ncbi:MAG: hypothetical protein Ta2E_09700 [Mycoplasmoidaceae bacterium]|nr:MAG: hypothetical protein Ta2E_09700 [Mycoplasmoidaceae bacterium]